MVAGEVVDADLFGRKRAPAQLEGQLADYARAVGGYDEMLAQDGSVRPHWRGFVAMGRPRAGRLAAAGESTRRLLRESGIAFNVYADPDDRAHAWRLDLVPVLLPEAASGTRWSAASCSGRG